MPPVDRLGRTPLHLSAQLGYGEAIKLLVDGGASVSAVDSAGRTARDLADEKGMERAIKALDGEPSTGYILRSSDNTLDGNFTQSNQLFSGFYRPVFLSIPSKESVYKNESPYIASDRRQLQVRLHIANLTRPLKSHSKSSPVAIATSRGDMTTRSPLRVAKA